MSARRRFSAVGRIVGVVIRFDRRNSVRLRRPGAEVEHLAALGAERPEPRGRRPFDWLAALRATNRSHCWHGLRGTLRARRVGTRSVILGHCLSMPDAAHRGRDFIGPGDASAGASATSARTFVRATQSRVEGVSWRRND
jgi:hypothetical protein